MVEPAIADNWATPELVAALQEIPATYINRFHVVAYGDHVRVTFGESVHGPELLTYRSAIVMKTADAEELARYIMALVQVINARRQAGSTHTEGPSGSARTE